MVTKSGTGQKFPHQTYMRLCCLEMERFRREQEKAAAMVRANKCESRCAQIEAEVRELLSTIGPGLVDNAATDIAVAVSSAVRVNGHKLTLKY